MSAASGSSFSSTVDALKHAVAGNGMMVLGSLNQAKALSMTGLSLGGAETFFVGSPTTGKMFFHADPAVGAVIPVRMYVWVGSSGKTEVGYFDPGSLLSAMDPSVGANAGKLSMMASKITQGATGTAPAVAATAQTTFGTVDSSSSFSSTVDALKHAVSGNGMMVLGSLNQGKALSMTGLSLNAETLFVGNPTTGKMLFQADPAAGMVVPVSMYVWGTSSGGSEIGYYSPGPLFSALSSKLSSGGQKLSMMASQIAKAAS